MLVPFLKRTRSISSRARNTWVSWVSVCILVPPERCLVCDNCPMKHFLGRTYLFLARWEAVGTAPDVDKYLIIVAPHTSNWDFVHLLMVAWAREIPAQFIGKHTLFRWPSGWLFRALGGMPVRRRLPGRIVEEVIEMYESEDRLALAMAPEGTRSHGESWKSGFYRIAKGADVPVLLGFIDFATRRGGVGPLIELTEDQDVDMATIAAFYADKRGKHPERTSLVRL